MAEKSRGVFWGGLSSGLAAGLSSGFWAIFTGGFSVLIVGRDSGRFIGDLAFGSLERLMCRFMFPVGTNFAMPRRIWGLKRVRIGPSGGGRVKSESISEFGSVRKFGSVRRRFWGKLSHWSAGMVKSLVVMLRSKGESIE